MVDAERGAAANAEQGRIPDKGDSAAIKQDHFREQKRNFASVSSGPRLEAWKVLLEEVWQQSKE